MRGLLARRRDCVRPHLRRVREEHDEQRGGQLERWVLGEYDVGGDDGQLARDDDDRPPVQVCEVGRRARRSVGNATATSAASALVDYALGLKA